MTSTFLAQAAALSLPFAGHPRDEHTQHHRFGPWSLSVTHERFAGEVKCKLAAHGADFEREAVVIRLGGGVDTSGAMYRVDGGPPRSVQADAMELAGMGFALHQDALANPSGGLVRIPVHLLSGARQVSVQARPGGPVLRYRLDGLDVALDAARTEGCGAAAFR
jgi:hypothetical protein